MWVRFLSDYDHKPKNNVILSYAAGGEYSVTHICGQAAIAAGKAVEIPAPSKGKGDGKTIKPDGAGAVAKAARQNPQRDKARSQEAKKQMEQEAAAIVAAMRGAVPVDTGALRGSIGWKWGRVGKGQTAVAQAKDALGSEMVLTIYAGNRATLKAGENNRYQQQLARLIEFGTRHVQKRPFFYGTWRMMKKKTRGNVRKSVGKAVKAVTRGGE